jgi:ABC-type multidrug transport system fused ATPase/permease subunit
VSVSQDHGPSTLHGEPTAAPVSLRRLLPFMRPYWRTQAITLCCLAGGTALSLLVPLLIGKVIDSALPGRDLRLLGALVAGMLAAQLGSAAFTLITDILFTRVSEGILRDLRGRLYDHLLSLPLGRFQATRTGQLTARVLGDVDALQTLTSDALLVSLTSAFSIVLTLVLMLTLSVPLTIAGVVSVGGLIAVFRAFDARLRAAAQGVRERYGEVSEHLHETIAGMREVKAFGHEGAMAALFNRVLARHFKAGVGLGVTSSLARVSTLGIIGIGPLAVYAWGGLDVTRGALTIGALVAFVAYLDRLYAPIESLSFLNFRVQAARAAMQRVFAFLDLEPAPRGGNARVGTRPESGALEIEDLSFAYEDDGAPPVLDGLSFTVRPGEKVAIVGPSGAGKSTLASLICRFYDPQRGAIRIDGADIRALPTADLRRLVAVVPQDTFLFHASILENLRVAHPEASGEALDEALRLSGAAEFVATLPDGLDTVVGERGVRLSGGQRQRLAIARAILRDPAVVVLDEATSALDPETERVIRDSMRALTGGRTTLVISHRLATVADADRIVVLEHGRIVDEGSHAELIARRGAYRRLFDQDRVPGEATRTVAAPLV